MSNSVRPHNGTDGSPPGSPVPGILQARTLEWVAISFSNAWKWKLNVKSLSCVQILATPWTAAYQAPLSMGFSKQEYWSGVPLPPPQLKLMVIKLHSYWVIANTLFQQHKRRLYTWTSPDGQYWNQTDRILCSQKWRSSIQSAKIRLGADCVSYHKLLYCQIQTEIEERRENY